MILVGVDFAGVEILPESHRASGLERIVVVAESQGRNASVLVCEVGLGRIGIPR